MEEKKKYSASKIILVIVLIVGGIIAYNIYDYYTEITDSLDNGINPVFRLYNAESKLIDHDNRIKLLEDDNIKKTIIEDIKRIITILN